MSQSVSQQSPWVLSYCVCECVCVYPTYHLFITPEQSVCVCVYVRDGVYLHGRGSNPSLFKNAELMVNRIYISNDISAQLLEFLLYSHSFHFEPAIGVWLTAEMESSVAKKLACVNKRTVHRNAFSPGSSDPYPNNTNICLFNKWPRLPCCLESSIPTTARGSLFKQFE